jgi:hypothetical protein
MILYQKINDISNVWYRSFPPKRIALLTSTKCKQFQLEQMELSNFCKVEQFSPIVK